MGGSRQKNLEKAETLAIVRSGAREAASFYQGELAMTRFGNSARLSPRDFEPKGRGVLPQQGMRIFGTFWGAALMLLGPGVLDACTPAPVGAPGELKSAASSDANAPVASAAKQKPKPKPTSVASGTRTSANTKPEPYNELVRLSRWSDAWQALSALGPEADKNPELRYVRARVSMELGEYARALTLLEGLESKLPELEHEIAAHRAQAQLEAGPHDKAAAYYSKSSDPESQLKAALAFEQSGDFGKARRAVNRALRAKSKDTELSAKARALRARLAQRDGNKNLALLDLRWLAIHAPTLPAAQGTDKQLQQLSPKAVLTAKERYDRATRWADKGHVEETEAELELAAKAPGVKPDAADVLHVRAWAHYIARDDYEEAARLFEAACKQGSHNPARDFFYAARSWSRANQDARAIKMYDDLARRYPHSSYVDNASYLAARLRFIMGDFEGAARAYNRYLSRHSKHGSSVKSARYELAICRLASKEFDKARVGLSRLIAQEKSDRLEARYRQLLGIALEGEGKKDQAIEQYQKVIEERPLSFPALVSAARLKRLEAKVPPPIEPAPKGPSKAALSLEFPKKVSLLHRLGLDADAEQALKSHEAAIRRAHSARAEEALCTLYGRLSGSERRYRLGQAAANWSELRVAPSDSTRWLWECIYPQPYLTLVREAERRWRLPRHLLYSVMRQESAFRPEVVSPANAVGLMQMIPATARRVAEELERKYEAEAMYEPPVSIEFGAFYLRKLLNTFGGSEILAASAYNAGPHAASRWLAAGEDLPLDVFVARIPYTETRNYVYRVIGNLARYTYLYEGGKLLELSLDLPKGHRANPGDY